MTDEEKETIECLKYKIMPELEAILEYYNEPSDWAYYTNILINLIEKQQKEIEELKEQFKIVDRERERTEFLNRKSRICFIPDGNSKKCLGYARNEFDDEPCDYCKSCKALNINIEDASKDG